MSTSSLYLISFNFVVHVIVRLVKKMFNLRSLNILVKVIRKRGPVWFQRCCDTRLLKEFRSWEVEKQTKYKHSRVLILKGMKE